MIKILFCFGNLPKKGGTEAVMENIYRRIEKEKFLIDFLFFGNPEKDNSDFSEFVRKTSKIYYVPALRDGIYKNYRAIQRILKENEYDMIHTHMDATGTNVLRIAKKCGMNIRIAHSHSTGHLENAHGIIDRLHRFYFEILRKRITHVGTHFIACSALAGEWLFGEKVCKDPEKYMVFRNAIDVERYQFDPSARERIRKELGIKEEKIIGHIGRFSYEKNHSYLIDIFSEVHSRNENVKLALIGEGEDMPEMKKKTADLGLKEYVTFLGKKDNVHEYLNAFDIFVFPSHHEGLPLALIEAEASGLKCLASDTISKEADVSGNVTFMNTSLEPEIWAESALELLKEETDRVSPAEEIRENGYDMKTNVRELEQFYLRIMREV